jgi:hypothetical protein
MKYVFYRLYATETRYNIHQLPTDNPPALRIVTPVTFTIPVRIPALHIIDVPITERAPS